jgi:lipopolysaccharide biosynthesis protein
MKSICFFSSYFQQNQIPLYVKVYLEELSRHFSEVVLITNEKKMLNTEIQYLDKKNIKYLQVVNEGFDFGMWYKAMKVYDVLQYDRIGLINDSCILFKKLDETFKWINSGDWDYCGMVDSIEYSYHIQSYFIVINKNAILPVYNYFMQNGKRKDILDVVKLYEIGLSTYLIEKGLSLGSCFSITSSLNPSLFCVTQLIEQGIPLIKKKIIFKSFREEYRDLLGKNFIIDPRYYIKLIKQKNTSAIILNLDLLIKDIVNPTFIWGIYWFKILDFCTSCVKHGYSLLFTPLKLFVKQLILIHKRPPIE